MFTEILEYNTGKRIIFQLVFIINRNTRTDRTMYTFIWPFAKCQDTIRISKSKDFTKPHLIVQTSTFINSIFMMLHLCYVNTQCSCVIMLGSYVDDSRKECNSSQNLFIIYNFKYFIFSIHSSIHPSLFLWLPH
jgi:hypothetical protein